MSTQADDVPDDYVPMDAYEELRAADSERFGETEASAAPMEGVQEDAATAPNADATTPVDATAADSAEPAPTTVVTATQGKAKAETKAPAKARQEQGMPSKVEASDQAPAPAQTQAKPTAPATAHKGAGTAKASTAARPQGYTLSIGQGTQTVADADEAFQIVFDAVEAAETTTAKLALLERNKVALLRAEQAGGDVGFTYAELESLARGESPESTPTTADTSVEEADAIDEGLRITPRDEKGESILRGYAKMFEANPTRVDAVLDANQDHAKKLTGKQRVELAKMAMEARAPR